MNLLMNRLIVSTLLVLLFLMVGVAHAGPFTNGSFESGVDPDVGTIGVGSTTIDGWEISSGNINYYGTYWQAADGGRSLDMNGNMPGTIRQTFDTIPDGYYEVRFAMAGNPDGANGTGDPPGIKELQVSAGDEFANFVFDSTGHSRENMGWEDRLFVFTADGNSTTLTFTSLHPLDPKYQYKGRGAALDNVSVNLVTTPEPASVLLLGSGLLGSLFGIGRRRWAKRQGSQGTL